MSKSTTAAPGSFDHPNAPIGREAITGTLIRVVAWTGWLAKGVVYVLAGVLSLYVAGRAFSTTVVPATSSEASPTGAIVEVGSMTGGRPLLFALALGLALYCVWRLLTAVLPGDTDSQSIAMRAGYLISALIYGTFALTAITLGRHASASVDGNRKVRDVTASVMHRPFGRVVIGIVGLIAVGVGLFRVVKAARSDVADELTLYRLSPTRLRWTRRFAVFGETGRGVAVALIGYFLVRSSITSKSSDATGLDGALKRLAANSSGRFVVLAIGFGMLLYGLMCIETITHRKLPLHESIP